MEVARISAEPDKALSRNAVLEHECKRLTACLDKAHQTVCQHRDAADAARQRSRVYRQRVDILSARLTAIHRYVLTMAESVGYASAYRSGGGQHVPWHGDYAAAVPSVLSTLRRQTKDLLSLLEGVEA